MKAARETVGWLIKDTRDAVPYLSDAAPYLDDTGWQPTLAEANVFPTYEEARRRRVNVLRGERRNGGTMGSLSIIRITKRAR